MRRALGALGAVIVSVAAGSSMRCPPPKPPARRRARATPAPDASPTPAPLARGLARAEAEPGARSRSRTAGPSTPPTLEAAAASPDAAVRARAALAAGRIGDERAAAVLLGPARGPCARRPRVRGVRRGHSRAIPRCRGLSFRCSRTPTTKVAAASRLVAGLPGAGGGPGRPAGALSRPPRPPAAAALLFALWRFPTPADRRGGRALRRRPGPGDRARPPSTRSPAGRTSRLCRLTTVPRRSRRDTPRRSAPARSGSSRRPASIEPLGAALDGRPPPVVTASLTALDAVLEKNPGASPPLEKAGASRDALERREPQPRDSGAGAPALLRGGVRPRGLPATLAGGQDGQRAAPTGRPARRRGGDSRAGPVPSRCGDGFHGSLPARRRGVVARFPAARRSLRASGEAHGRPRACRPLQGARGHRNARGGAGGARAHRRARSPIRASPCARRRSTSPFRRRAISLCWQRPSRIRIPTSRSAPSGPRKEVREPGGAGGRRGGLPLALDAGLPAGAALAREELPRRPRDSARGAPTTRARASRTTPPSSGKRDRAGPRGSRRPGARSRSASPARRLR